MNRVRAPGRKEPRATIGAILTGLAYASLLLGLFAGPVLAQDQNRAEDQRRAEEQNREHQRPQQDRDHRPPPREEYEPPQTVYGPPPVVDAPPAYYSSPGISIVLPFSLN